MNFGKTSARSWIMLSSVVALSLLLLNVWSLRNFWAVGSELQSVSEEYSESQRLVDDMKRLQTQPRIASLEEESPSGLTERVSQALLKSRIDSSALDQVQPSQSQRQGKTMYVQRPTTITLRGVTMQQIVEFSQALEDPNAGLSIRDLRLTPSRDLSLAVEGWDVDLTLTQLIFSPTS